MKKAIIFNGPPSCGKDHGALHVCQTYGAALHAMKDKLVEMTKSTYCVGDAQWEAMYTRKGKETPQEVLNGRTPRQALIHMAEEVIKPKFGRGYFGWATARMLDDGLNAIGDGGFIEEITEFSKVIGPENILVFRVYTPESEWGEDSRGYLDEAVLKEFGVKCVNVHNDKTPSFMEAIERHIEASGIFNECKKESQWKLR